MGGVGVEQATAVQLVLQVYLGIVVHHPPSRDQEGLLDTQNQGGFLLMKLIFKFKW